jgi:serine phosphatase RsbU (regulator of sigma subunit)
MDSFKRNTIQVLKEDRLYLLSDGIYDQFGGPHGRKYMSNAFKTTLLKTLTSDIKDQKQQIEDAIDNWQAYINPKTGFPYEQIDDICMLGIKI